MQLRSLVLSLIESAEPGDPEPPDEAFDASDALGATEIPDDLREEFEDMQPTTCHPRRHAQAMTEFPEPSRVNTLDALVAELRSVYGGPRAQGSRAAPLQPPPPPRGQGSRAEPLPPRTQHSRAEHRPAAPHAQGSRPVPSMAPTPHGARGSVHRLDEANLDRLPRRSPAELTPGAFPIVARPAHPDSRAPRRPAASVPPPRAPSAIPAPRRMRDDQTEPQVMAVVDMEPAPDAQGSRVERLIDDTRRDRPGRR